MSPYEVSLLSRWPDLLALTVITILVAIIAQVLVNLGIRSAVKIATKSAEYHRDSKAGRTLAILTEGSLDYERSIQRARTMGSILKSIASFVIWTVAILTIMGAAGLPLAPLLASAGIGGVALGFGAQSLVKDFLAGVFMIIEDQYGVGDIINTGEITGTVEDIGLRVTRLRDSNGQIWYIRNGEITRIGNVSQGWSTAMVDIPISYDADTPHALAVLREVATAMDADEQWHQLLLEPPTVLGVDSIQGNVVTLRIMVKTCPNQQWGVARELRERAKVALAQAGIAGPIIPPVL
ncbi:MAG: mechanosensitive ion channel family protein [Propionibacteriaceae bacterium]